MALTHSIEFDGTDDHVAIGNSIWETTLRGSFTVTAWLKIPENGEQTWFSGWNGGRNNFYVKYETTTLSVYFSANWDDGRWNAEVEIPTTEWFHYTVTCSQDVGGDSEITQYINGVQLTTEEAGALAGSNQDDFDLGSNNFAIGYDPSRTSHKMLEDSAIHDLSLHSRVLDGDAATALYNGGFSHDQTSSALDNYTADGLVGYWQFNENTGTSAADSSSNSNVGTLTNGPVWSSSAPITPSIGSINGVDDANISSFSGQTPNLDLSGSASTAPSVSVSGGVFGILEATITKSGGGTYTNPNYSAECTLADGTVTVTDANIDRNLESDLSHLSGLLNITDTNASTAQRTLTVKAQEFGDNTQSAGGTATYTPSSIQAEYIRIWSCLADGTVTTASNQFAIKNWRLYTGSAQSGTELPPDLTSATSATDIVVSAGHVYSSFYDDWKAFDSNTAGSWWWSIGNTNVANQWLQIQFQDGTYDTKPIIKSMKILFYSNYFPEFIKITSSASADHSSPTTHIILPTTGYTAATSTHLTFG